MVMSKTDDSFPPVMADTSDLPHRVKSRGMELALAIVWICFGLIAGGFGVFILADPNQPPMLGAAFIAFGAAALFGLSRILTPYLVLYPDRLERRGLTGWRTLMRSEIQGVRSAGSDRGGALIEIVPRQLGSAAIILRKAVRKDPIVDRWLQDAPDLDALALAAETSAILADERYGATPAERKAHLDRAKQTAIGFSVVCLALAVGMFFVPGQYQAHLALAVIPVAIGAFIVHRSNGLFVWVATTKARPSLIAALAPAASAAFQSMSIDTIGDLLLWIAGGGGLAALAIWASIKGGAFQWRSAFGALFVSGIAIYGLGNLVNVAFAPPGVQTYPLLVNGKYTSGSRSTSYHLKVAAWADQPAGSVRVPSDYYYKVEKGSLVCIYRHKGGLGVDWYEVGDCQPGSQAPPEVQAQFEASRNTASQNSQPAAPIGPSPANYPEAAWQAGKEGEARVKCDVAAGPRLTNCQVMSEDPPGLGFGAAALQRVMAPNSGVKLDELKGHDSVIVPVHFKLAK
jgi:hypothetical protein